MERGIRTLKLRQLLAATTESLPHVFSLTAKRLQGNTHHLRFLLRSLCRVSVRGVSRSAGLPQRVRAVCRFLQRSRCIRHVGGKFARESRRV